MIMKHCCRDFEAKDVWVLQSMNSLEPNKMFNERKLLIGECPVCEREVVQLFQTRVFDNQVFITTEVGYKADLIKQREKKQIIYTQNSVPKGALKGFVFGENKEIHGRGGKVIANRQRACDWSGQRHLVKEIKVK